MNQSFFKPRMLLLATALATAGVVSAQTTNTAPAASPTTPPNSATTPATTNQMGSDATLKAAKPSTDATANGNVSAAPMPKTAAAPKAATAGNDQTQIASSTPRNNSGAQSKTSAKANPADNKFRAELRNCAQQTGDQRESCLDRAIEHHQQS